VEELPPLLGTGNHEQRSACHFQQEMPGEITEVGEEIGVDLREGQA
jgi:hypothetical protein